MSMGRSVSLPYSAVPKCEARSVRSVPLRCSENLSVSRRAYGDVEQDLAELRRTLNQ
jgi:hypothetical protein